MSSGYNSSTNRKKKQGGCLSSLFALVFYGWMIVALMGLFMSVIEYMKDDPGQKEASVYTYKDDPGQKEASVYTYKDDPGQEEAFVHTYFDVTEQEEIWTDSEPQENGNGWLEAANAWKEEQNVQQTNSQEAAGGQSNTSEEIVQQQNNVLQTTVDVLPNVPDRLRNNQFLQERMQRSCSVLRDNVAVTMVFVDDDVSGWNQNEIDLFMNEIQIDMLGIMEEAAGWGVPLSITYTERHCRVGGVVTSDNGRDFFVALLEAAGLPCTPEPLNVNYYLETGLDVQEAPIVFVFNKDARSWTMRNGNAECVMLFGNPGSFRHELYHLFGAADFYYPDEVLYTARECLGESIMYSGGEYADELTAYLMGWTDLLSVGSETFLERTNHLTKESLAEANKKETFTGYGTKEFGGGEIYTGYLEKGMPWGYGIMYLPNGAIYEGNFVNGVWEGQGKYTFADGTVYEGAFVKGAWTGWGRLIWNNGMVYEGDFVNNEQTGKGRLQWPDGTVYEGEFYCGKFHGQGVMYWPNGQSRSGQWNNGTFVG